MRWVICFVVGLVVASFPGSGAAQAPEPEETSAASKTITPGWERVTRPGGTGVIALRLGYRDEVDSGGSHVALQGDFAIGLTDRVEVRPLFGLAVRLGSPETAEVLLHGGTNGIGFVDGGVLLTPTLGAQGILPVGRGHRLILGARASTYASMADSLGFYSGKWMGTALGGWSVQVGERLLFTAGVGLGRDWGHDFRPLGSNSLSMEPFVEVGSVVAHAGGPLPLISYRITNSITIDASASIRFDDGRPPLMQVLGGFGFWR